MNNIILIGRLTKNPELRYVKDSKTAVSSITIATDRDYKNKDGSISTDFIPVELFGKSAEFCINYLEKGSLVCVQGSIRVDNYEDSNGNRKTFTKVVSSKIQALSYKKKDDFAETDSIEDEEVPF